MNSAPLLVGLILCQFALSGCNPEVHLVQAGLGHGLVSLLDGFACVGMDVDRVPHTTASTEMPSQMLTTHRYVFHHLAPFDDIEFARTVLPDRLRLLGLRVTRDVDHGPIASMDPGGIIWGVQFAGGACTGSVGASPCGYQMSRRLFKDTRWSESDYFLVVHGQCPM